MFSGFFIARPKFAFVISIVIVLAGLIAIRSIPVAEFPDIAPPQVQVTASYPGADAQVVQEAVAAPIEAEVNGVDGMLYMSSTSSNGGGYALTITFAVGTDPDIAAVNVQNRVAIAQSRLPQDVVRQGVVTRKQSSNMLMVVNLTSPEGTRDGLFLSNYASIHLQDALSRLPGVGNVAQFGALDYGMRVWLDPNRLAALKLTATDVAGAIRAQNVQATAGELGAPPFGGGASSGGSVSPPGGASSGDGARAGGDTPSGGDASSGGGASPSGTGARPDGGTPSGGALSGGASLDDAPQFQYAVRARGRLASVEEFANVIVRANPDGSFVRLNDVARVELGSQVYNAVSKLNNRPAAMIALYQSPGANALTVADAVHARLAALSQRFPPDVEYKVLYDTTQAVRASVQEVVQTLFITFVLVVAVTFLFLGDWRSTLIPTLAIPVSLIGAYAALYALGFSANMITLFATILAIGVVVDDSIVVVENVQRVMAETGQEARAATRQAMGEVTGPVVATTLVLLAVFVPVSFMPGITGELYKQFSVTICVAVVLSSVNALTLSPALCALLLKPPAAGARPGLFARMVGKMRDGYAGLVGGMIRRSGLSMLLFAAFAGGAVFLFRAAPTGFLPLEDKGAFFVNVQLPAGASLARTEAAVERASAMVREVDGVTDVISVAGFSLLGGAASNSALIIPILAHWDERTAPGLRWYVILGEINRRLATLLEADAFAFPPPPIIGVGTSGGIEAQLQDFAGRSPQDLAAALRALVFNANQDPALANVFSTYAANVPQLFLHIDRDKAEALGVPVAEIFSVLQASLGSSYVNDFNLFGKVYRVILQAEARYRNTVEDVGRLHVRNAAGDMIPLRALVADVETILGPLSISRYNQVQAAALSGSNRAGFSTGEAIGALEALAGRVLPQGYALEWTGTSRQELEAGGLVAVIFALALVFAYLFLVAQYESWGTPVPVVLSVVIAVFGALVPLVALPFLDNNLYAQIGMVMLIGLASKNAILIVEFAKVRRDAGLPAAEAAVSAARLRFRAVMMTALSFILGVLPLVFASGAGAASRTAIGYVVLSGMVAATVVGVVFVPVLYWVVERVVGGRGAAGEVEQRPAGADPA